MGNSCCWHFICYAAAKLLQSCPTLCDPIDGSPPGSPIPGILQARTLEWVAIFFSNAWKWKVKSEVTQSCQTLSNPMDCSPPGLYIISIVCGLGLFFFFWPCWVSVTAWGIFTYSMWALSWGMQDLVPWPRINPRPPALGMWNLNHWATREVPGLVLTKNSVRVVIFILLILKL